MVREGSHSWLCRIEDIDDPGGRGFTVELDGKVVDIMVVREEENAHAYLNHCPHTGSPLDWIPEQFLSIDKKHIQCATHDALFRIDNGLCISGPCHGDSLKAIPLRVEHGCIFLSKAGGDTE